MTVDGYEVFHFVSDALLFITLIASFTLSILAVIRLRIQRDPARKVFSWVKATWLIFLIAVVMSFCQVATATITARYYEMSSYDDNTYNNSLLSLVARVTSIADAVARFMNMFVEIAVFLTMVTFKRCIDTAHVGGKTKINKWPRRIAYVTAGILTMIITASFGLVLYLVVISQIDASPEDIRWDPGYAVWQLSPWMDLATQSILAFTALVMTVHSIVIKRRCRFTPALRKPTTYLVVCMCMWLVRSLFDVYLVLFNLFVSPFYSAPINGLASFNEVLQVIFVTWPIFILLTILYALGVHKTHSLRSVEQPPLMEEVESQTANADTEPVLAPTQSATTPMTETAPTEISVVSASHNPFPWDGLSDAPPQYTPANAAITRRPVPQVAELPAEETLDSSLLTTNNPSQPPSQVGQADSNDSTVSSGPSQPEHSVPQYGTNAVAGPASASWTAPQVPELSVEPPSHDEAMGLYHQADGMAPRSQTLPYDEKR